nr:glycosyltransferase family 2 protein [Bacilli bacterium]
MLTILIVTYHSTDVLPACIASLAKAKKANTFVVHLLDNASTDDTVMVSQQLQASYGAMFADFSISQLAQNRGFAHANNQGLQSVTTPYVLLLNPDTIVAHDAIVRMLDHLQVDDRVGMGTCRLTLADGRIDKACRRSLPTLANSFWRLTGLSLWFSRSRLLAGYNLTYLDEQGIYDVECISGAFMLFRTSLVREIGMLDEDFFMYGEDIDYCYRVKKAGYRILYDGTVTTVHLKGGNGGKKSAKSLQSFYATMLIYYDKHFAKDHPRLYRMALQVFLGMIYRIAKLRQLMKKESIS